MKNEKMKKIDVKKMGVSIFLKIQILILNRRRHTAAKTNIFDIKKCMAGLKKNNLCSPKSLTLWGSAELGKEEGDLWSPDSGKSPQAN